ncbi:MAG: SEC-C metal-binding domain-containing protein [Thermoanaerobaculia bacterium]
MTAFARAFLPFYEQHRDLFGEEEPERVVFTPDDAIAVTLTAPHPALDDALLDDEEDDPFVEPPLLIRPSVGRNDPGPCGSGKKYKKCHLDADSR